MTHLERSIRAGKYIRVCTVYGTSTWRFYHSRGFIPRRYGDLLVYRIPAALHSQCLRAT